MRKVNIYTIGKKELITTLNIKNRYESVFWHENMPTIGERRCKEILKKIGYTDSAYLIFEWCDNGFVWGQELHKNGTILIG